MFRIAAKDLAQFVRDRRGLALTFLLPIGLITIFYFTFGGGGTREEGPVVSLIVHDADSSAASRSLVASLDSLAGLRLEEVRTADHARDLVRRGKRAATLLVEPGFGDSVAAGATLPLELVFDSGRPMAVGILQQILYGQIGALAGESQGRARARRRMMAEFGFDEATANALLDQMDGGEGGNETAAPFRVREVMGEREDDFTLIQAVAGTAVMLLLFSVAGMGAGLLQEREEGTLRRLLLAPISPNAVLFGKLLAAVAVSVTQLVLMFVFASLAFGLDLGRNVPGLALMILATALACASLGMLLASVSRTRKQLDGLGTILILVMSAIGGSMMPVVFMPAFVQRLARGTVNFWAIDGYYDLYWRGLGLSAVLDNAGILIGIAVVLVALSLPLYRRNILRLT
jgi:ABC-type multidrug transport system permease subunit